MRSPIHRWPTSDRMIGEALRVYPPVYWRFPPADPGRVLLRLRVHQRLDRIWSPALSTHNRAVAWMRFSLAEGVSRLASS